MAKGENVFDGIAGIYGWFYGMQRRWYQGILERAEKPSGLHKQTRVLDVGCGTAALTAVLRDRGYEVTGLDPSERMLAVARRRKENQGLALVQGSGTHAMPFADKTFDAVITSYVAHGLPLEERKRLYGEMRRVARHLVILQDYNQKRGRFTDFIEWLEGGDYFRFIQQVEEELRAHFPKVHVLDMGKRTAWYVMELHPEEGNRV